MERVSLEMRAETSVGLHEYPLLLSSLNQNGNI
jgi:hypothetical protein